MRVLITGMCGFLGHHVAEYLLKNTDLDLVALDRIDATSSNHRLLHIDDWAAYASRVRFVWHDLRAPINTTVNGHLGSVDAVLHLAASTHVDRSISDPGLFLQDNVMGTFHLLEWWRERCYAVTKRSGVAPGLYVQFGTDEVFGPAPRDHAFGEWDRYCSSNPYSASKAAAEELACAYSNTYNLWIQAAHGMNIFGERQHPEKFIPMTIRNIIDERVVRLHGDPATGHTGSRFYLHAENVASALLWLLRNAPRSRGTDSHDQFDKWNIVGEVEVSNLRMAQMIAELLDKPLRYEIVDWRTARPGYDQRYSLDGSKLKGAGFKYGMSFDKSLERTVRWFVDHEGWLRV